jgi:DNA-binding transcriptional regulator GbsR (MarR family)
VTDEAASTASASGEIERRVIDLFVDGVRVLGLPKSIGEIYGTLFLSEHPLAFDDLVDRLGISKGSVSQGLRALRQIGAVSECPNGTGRRTYYQPETQLKRLVGGFIREQVVPHLDSGTGKLATLKETLGGLESDEHQEFLNERLERLEHWFKRSRLILPLFQRVLGE